MRRLPAVSVVVLLAAVFAAAGRADTCSSSAAFKLVAARAVYGAQFAGVMRTVEADERRGWFDVLHHSFPPDAGAAAVTPLPAPCDTAQAPLRASATLVLVSSRRLNRTVSGFPTASRPSNVQWRAAYRSAIAGQQAAIRAAPAAGVATLKVTMLQADLAALQKAALEYRR